MRSDYYLMHYGVKGMKWRHRRNSSPISKGIRRQNNIWKSIEEKTKEASDKLNRNISSKKREGKIEDTHVWENRRKQMRTRDNTKNNNFVTDTIAKQRAELQRALIENAKKNAISTRKSTSEVTATKDTSTPVKRTVKKNKNFLDSTKQDQKMKLKKAISKDAIKKSQNVIRREKYMTDSNNKVDPVNKAKAKTQKKKYNTWSKYVRR